MRPSSAGVVLEARNVWPSYFRLEEIEAELWQQGWKGHFDYMWWLPEIGTTKQSVAFLRFKNKADIKLLKDKYIDGDIRTAKEQDLSQCVTLLRQIYKTYEDALPFLPRFYNPWGEHMPLKTLSAEDASLGTMVPLDPMSAAYLPKNDFRREDQLRGIENFHHKSWQKGDKGWSSGKPLHHDPWAKNRENAGSMYHGGKGGGMYHGGKGGMGIYSDGKGGGMGIYPDGKGGGMGFYPDGKGGGMGIYPDGKGGGMGIYPDGKGGGMGRHPDSKGGGMGRYPDGKGGGMYHDGRGDRRVPNYEGDIGGVVPFYMGKGVKNDTVSGKIDLTQTVLQDDWAVGARKNGPHQRDDQRKDRADRPVREERQHQSDIDALEERMRRLEVRDPDFTRAHWREEPMRSPPQDHRSLPRSGDERHFALRIPPWGERRNDLGPLHLDENSILPRGERRNELGPRHVNERVKSPHPDRVFEDILSTHSSRGRDSAFDVLSSHARRCGEPVRWSDSRQVGDDRRRGYGQYGDERGNPRSGEEQAPHHYREEREAEKENERPWYPANTKNTVQEEAVKELRQTYFRLARAVMDHPIYRLPDSQKGSSGCVEKGEEVEVVQICGEWANIIFPSTGNKAWVFENALDVQKCPSCSYFQTTICPGYCCKCCKQTPGSHGPKCLRYEAPL